MKLEVGKTYLDTEGNIVGPMTIWDDKYGDHVFDWTVANGANPSDKIYRADGTSDYNPALVREVLYLPEGSFAVTRDGKKIGPVKRVSCYTSVDPAGFYYSTPQYPSGHFTDGMVVGGSDSPNDIVGPWVETDVLTVGAVTSKTETITTHTINPGKYGNLIVGTVGTSGERVPLKLQRRYFSKAEILELVELLTGIANALPDPRT